MKGKISNYFEGVGVISHISHSNPLGYDVVFSVSGGDYLWFKKWHSRNFIRCIRYNKKRE